MCKEVHQSIEHQATKFEQMLKRKVYNTPKSYLDLINLYMQCLKEKREALSNNLRRMKSGITKLESSNKLVADLKVILMIYVKIFFVYRIFNFDINKLNIVLDHAGGAPTGT